MAGKRKHRVLVEITFEEPTTQAKAARSVGAALVAGYQSPTGFSQTPRTLKDAGVTKIASKQGERVIAAEKRKGTSHAK